ncbi:C4b-binding protein beta chain-like [Glandiceps talaboti]
MPDTLTHGTEVTITCDGGTTLTGGDATRTCMNGDWSGTMPTCEASGGTTGGDCSALTAPTNGSLSSTVVTSGTDVTVSCNEGFTRCGDEKITCTDAKWSGAVATCKTECDDDDKDGGVIPTLSKFLAWNMIVVVLAFLNM